MRTLRWAVPVALFATLFVACQEDSTTSSTGTSTTDDDNSTSANGGSGGTSGSQQGGGGTGGSTSDGGAGVGGSGTGGQAPNPCEDAASPTVLINEVVTGGIGAEYFELWNPGDEAVDLSSYFISDNEGYHGIAAGQAWDPVTNNAGTDFLAQFPPGTMIGPDEVIVVQTGTDFYGAFTACPDFVMSPTAVDCNGTSVPPMIEPTNGGIGDQPGSLLSGSREMLMLFCWGPGVDVVYDVDYVTWGDEFEDGTRVDKTAVTGYAADTAKASQLNAAAPSNLKSIERCDDVETDEAATGGNGILGHDETSEDMAASFPVTDPPTPGTKGSCD